MSQNGTAVCTDPALSWSFNTLGQSPCVVAEYLGGACNAGQFTVGPLGEGNVYLGPTIQNANSCRCSSVFYSMISACAACQGRAYRSWSSYETNCTTVYLSVFSQRIPSNTAVPNYAYQNVTTDDTFDLAGAQLDGGPESTSPPLSTRTSTEAGPSSTLFPPSSGSSNAGPIAGGIVGGIAFLALVAGLVFWWIRRRATTAQSVDANLTSDVPATPVAQTPMGYSGSSLNTAGQNQRLYNPSDPSTFPSSPFTSSGHPSSPTTSGVYVIQHEQPYNPYTGVPEPNTSPSRNYTGAPEL